MRTMVRIALIAILLSALGAAVALATVPAHAAATQPTLGIKPKGYPTEGFGKVRPKTISYGGDETSIVAKIKWKSWGGSRAVGHGVADWVWPGWCVACGSVGLKATVVAFGLSKCGGHPAYQYVEWYFPSRGGTFNRRLTDTNLCPGHKSPAPPKIKIRRCSGPTSVAGGGIVRSLVTYDVGCAPAKTLVKEAGLMKHYDHNTRLHTHGWWCGSELSMQNNKVPPQDFTCGRGDFEAVTFKLSK